MNACRSSTEDDLQRLAACHMRAFPDSLSTMQGAAFVRKMLEWYIVSERGVLFHLEEAGRVVGYCGGIRIPAPGLPGAITSISQHSFWAFVRAYLKRPWLLLHRENVKRWRYIGRNLLIRAGLRSARSEVSASEREEFRTAWGLVVIGVLPECQGKGHGGVLLGEFERRARLDGVRRVQLSVKASNERALRAYRRAGWTEAGRERESVLMRKELIDEGDDKRVAEINLK